MYLSRSCVIYDCGEYGKRLANAMSIKVGTSLDIQLFTVMAELKKYLIVSEPEVLIVSEEYYVDELKELFNKTLIIMTEEAVCRELIQEKYGCDAVGIYRYQSFEKIYSIISDNSLIIHKSLLSDTKLIGIYSPVCVEPKTAFALNMARILGQRGKTLYINLEDFSGLDEILPPAREENLSDAFYYYMQGRESSIDKILSVISNVAGFDYFSPVRCAEDISSMEPEQIIDFVECIEKHGGYEFIVLDISNSLRQSWKLTECCNVVYVPVKGDYLSLRKMQSFETYFCGTGFEHIIKRVVKIRIPEGEGEVKLDYWNNISFGGMNRYVTTLLEQREVSGGQQYK